MTATIMQQPELQMKTAVESANKLINGETLNEKKVYIPVKLIDKDNVEENIN
jgi:ABC-type sugar transport system substrate-binding protein